MKKEEENRSLLSAMRLIEVTPQRQAEISIGVREIRDFNSSNPNHFDELIRSMQEHWLYLGLETDLVERGINFLAKKRDQLIESN